MEQADEAPALVFASHSSLAPAAIDRLAQVGEIANQHAARGAISDYLSRRSDNTIRSHAASIARFAAFLDAAAAELGAGLAEFAAAVGAFPDGPAPEIEAWRGVSWGLVEAFRNWMVAEGDAVASINARVSAIKVYAKLAMKAGVLDDREYALIKTVSGYSAKEGKRVDERRPMTRRGGKKAQHVSIGHRQTKKLKQQPDTPQGRRDAVLMCLLLDHGLRCGELGRLKVSDVDLKTGEMRFYRPKVDKQQTHKLSADAARALAAWFDSGDALREGPLLRGSRKGGELTAAGMNERSITERVKLLGQTVGLDGLSAHDCRHYWATFWAKRVDVLRLQEAGGWSSLAMPRRYVEESEIANEGMA